MSEIIPFDYSGQQVRTLTDLDGNTWFVAADVCAVLGLNHVNKATQGLDGDERNTVPYTDSSGRSQQMVIVSEPGLYTLLVRSRRPEAKPFRRWVTHEVLPALRRTGSYSVEQRTAEAAPVPAADPLDVLAAMVAELRTNRETANRALTAADEAREETRVVSARLDAIEGRHDHYAALGWARLAGWTRTDDVTLARLGRIAGTVGRAQGLAPGKAPHAHYGEVNTWPAHVWDEAARRFTA